MLDIIDLRTKISSIDSALLRLLDERMELARHVAEYKMERDLPIIDEVREREILEKIPEAYRQLWDMMMDVSKQQQFRYIKTLTSGSLQEPILHPADGGTNTPTFHPSKIAIQWGKWSFNEIAIRNFLDSQEHGLLRASQWLESGKTEIIYAYTTAEVLRLIARGEVEYGQFAIANSIGGLVMETLEALGSKHWEYITHYAIPVRHCLMIHPEAKQADITTIMWHEQAIRQCEKTLEKLFPNAKKIWWTWDFTDNASVAEWVANGTLPITTASIGHESLADIYGLTIIERDIQDRDDNMTTFVLIKKR